MSIRQLQLLQFRKEENKHGEKRSHEAWADVECNKETPLAFKAWELCSAEHESQNQPLLPCLTEKKTTICNYPVLASLLPKELESCLLCLFILSLLSQVNNVLLGQNSQDLCASFRGAMQKMLAQEFSWVFLYLLLDFVEVAEIWLWPSPLWWTVPSQTVSQNKPFLPQVVICFVLGCQAFDHSNGKSS